MTGGTGFRRIDCPSWLTSVAIAVPAHFYWWISIDKFEQEFDLYYPVAFMVGQERGVVCAFHHKRRCSDCKVTRNISSPQPLEFLE